MNREPGNSNNQQHPQEPNPWDSLSQAPQQGTPEAPKSPAGTTFQAGDRFTTKESEFERITGEAWPGTKYTAELVEGGSYGDKANSDFPLEQWEIRERADSDQPEKAKENFGNFQVWSGTSKEAEFERLTGEPWPGVNYVAENIGIDDNGYDEPHEEWVVYKLVDSSPESEPADDSEAYEKRLKELLEREGGPEDFEGEQNINRATGKKRTRNTFDLYPQTKIDEGSHDAYMDRLRHNKELREKFEAGELSNPDGEESDPASTAEEERARAEAEEKAKREEELKALEEEEKKLEEEAAKLEEEGKKLDEELSGPLAAINADFTHDRSILAHDIAETQINEEAAKSSLIKRIWKGNLFKKYYWKKRERELLSGDRLVNVEGTDMTIDEMIRDRSSSAIQRFVLGATENIGYVHKQAGEDLVEADAETTKKVKDAIMDFASAKIPEDGSLEDIKRKFAEALGRTEAGARDAGKPTDKALIDNYLEVAIQARQKAEHDISIDAVMEGFKVYNAEVRDNVRTEAHRDKIDKLVDLYESSRFGQFIPPEIVAGALGTVWALTQTGAKALGGTGFGIAVSGLAAGARERNRVTEDRARMLRDAANGGAYEGTTGTPRNKRERYEARIGGTLYDMQPANTLIENIEQAQSSGNREDLLRAIAEARVRIDLSDSAQKDLISYSSTGNRGDERTRLDMATIRAEKSLSSEDQATIEAMRDQIQKEKAKLIAEIEGKDRNFTKFRTAQAVKQAGKAVLIGTTVMLGSQEIMAAVSPTKIGIFEKAGLLKTENNPDSSETILASAFGGRGVQTIANVPGDDTVTRNQLKQAGYTETQTTPPGSTVKTTSALVDPHNSTSQADVVVDGWANNGTMVSDGNETRVFLQNGTMTSGMYGASTLPNGQAIDYDAMVAAGRVKAYITIDNTRFELAPNAGQGLSWGQNGIFTTAAGENIQLIGSNGEKLYRYFEVAVDNGVDANGTTHIIPLATDIGAGTFSGKIQQVAQTTVQTPGEYTYTKLLPRYFGGVVAAPTARTGLGSPRLTESRAPATPAPEQPAPAPEQPTPSPEQPSPTPGQPVPASPEQPAPSPEPAPEPSPEPVPVPQPTGGETPESVPEPEPTGNPTGEAPNPQENLVEQYIRDNLSEAVGDEGVELMTTEQSGDAELSGRIAQWWNGLSDDAKNQVIDLERGLGTSRNGLALRQWLQANSLITAPGGSPQPAGQPQPAAPGEAAA